MDIEDIREIKVIDFHLVVDLIQESKLIDEGLLDLENAVSFIKHKLERNKAKIFTKTENGIPVAFIILYYKVSALSSIRYNWHISYLYVKPEHRRKNIAKIIMMKCIDYARKTKVDHISLNTDILNYPAHQLYESFGFHRVNFTSNYYCYEMKLNY
jgi:ribosomal protein S18 acetylase RimI-like enzyme